MCRALDWTTAPEAGEYTVDTADTGSLQAHRAEELALRPGRPVPCPGRGNACPPLTRYAVRTSV